MYLESIQNFGFSSFLQQADQLSLGVLFILAAMSLASWYLIMSKTIDLWLFRRRADRVIRACWATTPEQASRSGKPGSDIFSRLVHTAIVASTHHRKHAPGRSEGDPYGEFLARALQFSIDKADAQLESGLTVLASVGSTAPFVGLFGTVWGIYHALIRIGATGNATIDQVAGPVGEALIMTALGLAVAVPAVLAYNAFVRTNRVASVQLEAFAHELHTYFTTGARLQTQRAAATESAEAKAQEVAV